MSLPTIVLKRRDFGDQGTFGEIEYRGERFVTGELPWRENRTGISCVPLGSYQCTRRRSKKFGDHYLLNGVDGRSYILIHAANVMGDVAKGFRSQLNGCIALGESLGRIGGQRAILVSRPALRRFLELTEGKPFVLNIITV